MSNRPQVKMPSWASRKIPAEPTKGAGFAATCRGPTPFQWQIKQATLILGVAIFLTIAFNYRLFAATSEVFEPVGHYLPFLLSMVLVLFCIHVLLLSLFASHYTLKPLLVVIFLIAAPVAYFSDNFSVIVDKGMILNLLQTDQAEVADLMTPELLLRCLLFGVLPAVVVWRLQLRPDSLLRSLRNKAGLIFLSLMLIGLSIFTFSAEYATFFREYKSIRYFSNPVYPIYAASQSIADMFGSDASGPLRITSPNAVLVEDSSKPELMIVVVGEAARADHFSLFGYERQTNPELERHADELSLFDNVQACGTSTAVSVPCMFSLQGRSDFDLASAANTENVLDVLQKMDVDVLWRDNNSGSKGVAARVPYQSYRKAETNPVCDTECRDVGMLSGLQSWIDEHSGDGVIVLHQMGNHGPSYYKRYPVEFERFKPACQSNNLSSCSKDEIVNAYDNAILYTDWFLSQVIELLRSNTATHEVAMLYVSDHGESLGENGIYLHGLPFALAPAAQTHVPLILWFGDHNYLDIAELEASMARPTTHDAISRSLLEYFEVEHTGFDTEDRLFNRYAPL